MAAPPRRTAQTGPRLNPASIEYWKAENQKLRERNQSLHRRLHKYKKYNPLLNDLINLVSSAHYKKTNENSHSFIKVIAMNSRDSSSSPDPKCTTAPEF